MYIIEIDHRALCLNQTTLAAILAMNEKHADSLLAVSEVHWEAIFSSVNTRK